MHFSIPLWPHGAQRAPYRGTSRQEFDAVIIGGGITGLSCAMELCRQGKTVCVVEQGRLASGTTGRSSAQLTTMFDSGWQNVAKNFGTGAAKLIYEGMAAAIDQIDIWQDEYGIDCGFRRVTGYYYAEPGQDVDGLKQEIATARSIGVRAEEDSETTQLPFEQELTFRIENQAEFNPTRYLEGLAKALTEHGCEVREETRVLDVKDGDPCSVQTDGGALLAGDVVMATHTPIGRSSLHAALEPHRSYIVVARLSGDVPGCSYWDSAEPYHYMRPITLGGERCLLIGGADHPTGETPAKNPFQELEDYARERFPIRDFVARTAAQYYVPADKVPMVGLLPTLRRTYVATGFNGDGLTLGSMAGKVIAGRIDGKEGDLSRTLDPLRLKLPGLPDFLKNQLNVAKHFVEDRLKADEPEKIDAIPAGGGALVHLDHRTWACARSEDGTLHKQEARCPHMGCVVQWNNIEKTWDCPCHGGRFDIHGKRLEGPPRGDLGHPDQ